MKRVDIGFSFIGIILNDCVKVVLLYFFYFYKGELNFKKMIVVRLVFSIGMNAYLIYHYWFNRKNNSLFWGPFLVEEIIMDLVSCSFIMYYAFTYYNVKVQWEIEYFLQSEMLKQEMDKVSEF